MCRDGSYNCLDPMPRSYRYDSFGNLASVLGRTTQRRQHRRLRERREPSPYVDRVDRWQWRAYRLRIPVTTAPLLSDLGTAHRFTGSVTQCGTLRRRCGPLQLHRPRIGIALNYHGRRAGRSDHRVLQWPFRDRANDLGAHSNRTVHECRRCIRVSPSKRPACTNWLSKDWTSKRTVLTNSNY